MNIVTAVISAAGFLLSVFNFIYLIRSNRERFVISVVDYADFGPSVRFLLCIRNMSARPLAITSVVYLETVCELDPKKIRGDPTAWNGATTPRFPLCVPACGAYSAYLEFVDPPRTPLDRGTTVSFEIQTTFRLVRKTVTLPSRSHYLNKKE